MNELVTSQHQKMPSPLFVQFIGAAGSLTFGFTSPTTREQRKDIERRLRTDIIGAEGGGDGPLFLLYPDELYGPRQPFEFLNGILLRANLQKETTSKQNEKRDGVDAVDAVLFVTAAATAALPGATIPRQYYLGLEEQAIDVALLASSAHAQTEFVRRLATHGRAKLRLGETCSDCVARAYRQANKWLSAGLEWTQALNDAGGVDPSRVARKHEGRFLGTARDKGGARAWWQMRRPARKDAWPPENFVDAFVRSTGDEGSAKDAKKFARDMLDLHSRLDTVARLAFNVAASHVALTASPGSLLSRTPSAPSAVAVHAKAVSTFDAASPIPVAVGRPCVASPPVATDYEASVLRIYRYSVSMQRDVAASGTAAPEQLNPLGGDSKGAHADLGILTIAPRGTVPGLQIFDEDKNQWLDAEEGNDPRDCVVFVGETLGLISNGVYRACMHRAKPPPPLLSPSLPSELESKSQSRMEEPWRMSMPYFLRGEPSAVLRPSTTVRDFMNVLFSSRWWRCRGGGSRMPDY